MSITVTLKEASESFEALIEKLTSEDEIIIERNGQPYLKVIPFNPTVQNRIPDTARGKVTILPGCFDPMTDEELREIGLLIEERG